MNFINKYILMIAFVLLTILAAAVRKPMIECISRDYLPNLIEMEGNYHTPLYMLLMQVLSGVNNIFLPEKTLFFLVKLLCMGADIFAAAMMAACVYDHKIGKDSVAAQEKRGYERSVDRGLASAVMYGAMLFLPMVLMNSPFWAHLDSISVGLLAGAWLLFARKKDMAAGILAGLACALLTHYAIVLGLLIDFAIFMNRREKEEGKAPGRKKRLGRIGNICAAVMMLSSLTGLLCGYSLLQCFYKLIYFWGNPGTWMLYPVLVLALFFCFYDKRWIPVWVLLETAVILDWGEFLYELPVLSHIVYILLYTVSGIWAVWNAKTYIK